MFRILVSFCFFVYTWPARYCCQPHFEPGYYIQRDPLTSQHHSESIYYEPTNPHSYGFEVKDEFQNTDSEQNKEPYEQKVYGSYRIWMANDRVEDVKYDTDHYSGYVADVSYSGPSVPYQYPEYVIDRPHHPLPLQVYSPINHDPYKR